MCGITVCVQSVGYATNPLDKSPEWLGLVKQNAARGPDAQRREDVVVEGTSKGSGALLSFVASTLHLRGLTLVPQPHTSGNSIFCWNGEVFEGLDVPAESNDGSVLVSALEASETSEEICTVMSKVEGPYAFVFYQRKTHRLFFGRDPLGRRSLLIRRPGLSNPCLMLSSVSAAVRGTSGFEEVDPRYIHCLDFYAIRESERQFSEDLHDALATLERTSVDRPVLFESLAPVNKTLPDRYQAIPVSGILPDDLKMTIHWFTEVLDRSVRLRVQNIPSPFSSTGSIQKAARVAVLYSGGIDSAIIAFLANRYIPLDEPIDLLNVAFENPRRLQSRKAENHSKINRKQKSLLQTETGSQDETYKVPDRISGLEELEELRRLCPRRQWNFVEVDVDYAESSAAKELVEFLMFPSKTVMDMSLALALYFASRGIGNIREPDSASPRPYTSSARVLLSGLGSDELLGGYSRHRSVFDTGGWPALIEELQLELDRLPSRNLGRDDRVVSCHGKETRYPFLSLSVVDFVAGLPVYLKVDPRLDLGVGDKMLLRLAARNLGLELASKRKKRAMQFGSHSARMEGGSGEKSGERELHQDV